MSKRKKLAEATKEKPTEEEALATLENALTQDTVEVALDSLEANVGYGSCCGNSNTHTLSE